MAKLNMRCSMNYTRLEELRDELGFTKKEIAKELIKLNMPIEDISKINTTFITHFFITSLFKNFLILSTILP